MRRFLFALILFCPSACHAQAFGPTITLRDSVLNPTTPITLTRAGARWESAPTGGIIYRYDADGLSVEVVGDGRYFGGFVRGSGEGKTPLVLFWVTPYSGPLLRAYGVDVGKVPPDPLPWVFYELE